MKETIKKYMEEQNEELCEKIRYAFVNKDEAALREVIAGISDICQTVFGRHPKVLGPVYALVLEAMIPAFTPMKEDRIMLKDLKKVIKLENAVIVTRRKRGEEAEG